MMEEVGTVVELRSPQVAIVLCTKGSFCEHCTAMDFCRMGDDNSSMLVEALNPLGADVGDRVKLTVSSATFLSSSFVVYIVPLLFLLGGALVGKLIGEKLQSGPDPDLLAALFGVAFLVGSFLTIRLGSSVLRRELTMPKITHVLEDD